MINFHKLFFSFLKSLFKIKAYDCFIFFNELELLEMRLNELDDYMDWFILVESSITHSGKEKPLYFKLNQDKFKKFLPKIIHIIDDSQPQIVESGNRWALEINQRNQIMRGLRNCERKDIIFISDIDEIPNTSKLSEATLKTSFFKKPVTLKQNLYYYFLNGFINNNWRGTVCCSYQYLIEKLQCEPQKVRDTRKNNYYISNGGWHFSYLGGVSKIIEKIESFSHDEFDTEYYKSKKLIEEKIVNGGDLFDRKKIAITYCAINKSFPRYLVTNQKNTLLQ